MNPKQQYFVTEYSKDLNATQAAIRAGYSPRTAESQGCRLLSNGKVKAEIAKFLKESTDRATISLTDVIAELKIIMLADMSQIASWTGNKVTMKASTELTPDALKAIESVATTSSKHGEPQLRVRLHSKLKAAELLIRIFELQAIEKEFQLIEKELGLLP
jgi:phage terminase small subunit